MATTEINATDILAGIPSEDVSDLLKVPSEDIRFMMRYAYLNDCIELAARREP